MTRRSKQLEATAYHEAGHAVAHILLKRGIEFVTIKPSDEYDGLTKSATVFSPGNEEGEAIRQGDYEVIERWRKIFEIDAMIMAAGNEAERFYSKKRITDRADKDWTAICHLLEGLCAGFEETSAYHSLIVARTRTLILNPLAWLQVEAIAKALLERETLTGAEVVGICNDCVQAPSAGLRWAEIQHEIMNYKRGHPLDLSEWKWTEGPLKPTGDQGEGEKTP